MNAKKYILRKKRRRALRISFSTAFAVAAALTTAVAAQGQIEVDPNFATPIQLTSPSEQNSANSASPGSSSEGSNNGKTSSDGSQSKDFDLPNRADNSFANAPSLPHPGSDSKTSSRQKFRKRPSDSLEIRSPETQDIYERIELLKRIYDRKEKEKRDTELRLKQQTVDRQKSPAAAIPVPEEVLANVKFAAARANREPISPSKNLQAPAAVSQFGSPAESSLIGVPTEPTAGSGVKSALPAAGRVVSKPVDVFELGNSLFQTGEFATALDTYQSIDHSTLTAFDSTWLDFLLATCHRKLGHVDQAAALYRNISNEKNFSNLVKASRQWLKHLDESTATQSRFEQLENEIEILTQRANNHVNGK